MSVAVYAFINGLKGLSSGGQPVEFGPALTYVGLTLAVCSGMALLGWRRNRALRSDLIALDVKSWIMSSCITGALLLAFGFGLLLRGTQGAWLLPYIDPLTLVVVSLAIVPVPLREVRQAVREILLATPPALRAQVEEVAGRVAREQGFLGYRTYVAEFGRAVQVELYFVVPKGFPPRPLEDWDALRDQVGEAIGGVERHRWLTVLFTADPEWAE
jgi:predicted Co/Zn/Cd cation transporter (cation efflux family)